MALRYAMLFSERLLAPLSVMYADPLLYPMDMVPATAVMLNPKDGLHAKALEVSATFGRSRIVTSEMVLTEVLNAFAAKGESLRNAACALVDQIRSNANAEIVPMTSNAFREAMERYRGRTDKTWGLTDCTSFLLMEQKGITDALSADRDFQQAGFKRLLLE
jgi:Predicted nucleic acid-binding protein, contains PIN domain